MTQSSILIFGGTGQIGRELIRELGTLGPIVAPPRAELDLTSAAALRETIDRVQPRIVVNAAAYTMVDQAEDDAGLCALLNAEVPAILAAACQSTGAALVHFSTDYVFDGTQRKPYVETDEPRPLSVYGRTKLEGERAVQSAGGASLIFRTAWVYSTRRNNFPRTMLRLAREREELNVVNDQVGAPTSASAIASGVAQVLGALSREPDFRAACEAAAGIYHMTASGSTTWYEFARLILASDQRAIEHRCRSVRPITTAEYPTKAARPAFSILDNSKLVARFDVRLPSWQDQWQSVLEQLRLSARSPFAPTAATRQPDLARE
jgi:dTDP-4-dehydrorhamnose reductase